MNESKTSSGAAVPCISLFGLWAALATGNFVYQAFACGNWSAAVERSWFQLAAFVALWLWQKATRPNEELTLRNGAKRNGGSVE